MGRVLLNEYAPANGRKGSLVVFFLGILLVGLVPGCSAGNLLPSSQPESSSASAVVESADAESSVEADRSALPAEVDLCFDEALLMEPDELLAIIDAEDAHAFYQIIDIRSTTLFEGMHVPYSINIPRGGQFALRIDEVHFERTIILVGHESYDGVGGVLEVLFETGGPETSVRVLRGGYDYWGTHGYPVTFELRRFC